MDRETVERIATAFIIAAIVATVLYLFHLAGAHG
jgi:hypothetical protein